MNDSFKQLIINKVNKLKEVVKNVIKSSQYNKKLDFIEFNDFTLCIEFSEKIYDDIIKFIEFLNNDENKTEDNVIDRLQKIINKLSTLISLYGCDTLNTLLNICVGNKYNIEDKYKERFNLLNCYLHPTRYKILDWKSKIKSNEENIFKNADNFECFKLDDFNINFNNQIFGLKVAIHNIDKQQTIVVYGWIEEVNLLYIEDYNLIEKISKIKGEMNYNDKYSKLTYDKFITTITLHDLLIYSNCYLNERYIQYVDDYNNHILKKSILDVINNFNNKDLMEKRNTIIMLLINTNDKECHYMAYLLYDLLSNDIHGIIDTYEQVLIYDSLPYNVKKYFKEAMNFTLNYPKKLLNIENNNLTLEQRICLLKVNDVVKEKAMIKLKEVKLKSEDTGSKAMQYLEGLLKIPFGIYKEEPILSLLPNNINIFKKLVERFYIELKNIPECNICDIISVQNNYTVMEINKYCLLLQSNYLKSVEDYLNTLFKTHIHNLGKTGIIQLYKNLKIYLNTLELNNTIIKNNYGFNKTTGNSVIQLRENIINDVNTLIKNSDMKNTVYNFIEESVNTHSFLLHNELTKQLNIINTNKNKIQNFMKNVYETLDQSVYGHSRAKKQIERIIGQWLNGDLTGYSIGFEGPPGVGKTSLAKKGIANCLKDENGVSRPFSFIAMGGSTNSSTIDGHNYTYVGSTWGKIVDILMDTKIMNPIIFIDELDKVSKTENGKEIIGILTHLIDQTQNDSFQDKYFNGINLNLSKALFIFSYNDVDIIDRILLDRIHRIKFDSLSLEDKLIIARKFILPEIYSKMGLNNIIDIDDEVILYIINNYTSEPGVRKLKELIFEIMGGINIDILKNDISTELVIPIKITIEDTVKKYLKEHNEIKPHIIHKQPLIGVINGLWANSLGNGGILSIEATYVPSSAFLDLKLTGNQGDVMKESMSVAKSLAWSLFKKYMEKNALSIQKEMEETKNGGLHIHVPEGATPKDGPSAGTAITVVLYSLFSNKKIKNDIAITGEICLQGRVTAIGGLELKLLGGIRAGVKTFIYPSENNEDFLKFMDKYKTNDIIKGINFIEVETIEQVLQLVYCD